MNWTKVLSETRDRNMRIMDNLSDKDLIELYNDYSLPDLLYSGKKIAIVNQFNKRNLDFSDISKDPTKLHTVSMNHKVILVGKRLLSLTISRN